MLFSKIKEKKQAHSPNVALIQISLVADEGSGDAILIPVKLTGDLLHNSLESEDLPRPLAFISGTHVDDEITKKTRSNGFAPVTSAQLLELTASTKKQADIEKAINSSQPTGEEQHGAQSVNHSEQWLLLAFKNKDFVNSLIGKIKKAWGDYEDEKSDDEATKKGKKKNEQSSKKKKLSAPKAIILHVHSTNDVCSMCSPKLVRFHQKDEAGGIFQAGVEQVGFKKTPVRLLVSSRVPFQGRRNINNEELEGSCEIVDDVLLQTAIKNQSQKAKISKVGSGNKGKEKQVISSEENSEKSRARLKSI